ncbi:hypothetical protein B484DRAFT_406476 [Ochromonadaceae sp. CCMP2298]|nr:hypothetical protein B484DRAFT_406476 [Ochromonadaceae sp. CCMP2298]
MEPAMGPTRREQLLERIWSMIHENTNYTAGVRDFLTLSLLSHLDLERILVGDTSLSDRESWSGLMQGLKLPRRGVVAALIADLRREASPVDVVEATPTGEAAIRKATCSLSLLHRRIEGHSLILAI